MSESSDQMHLEMKQLLINTDISWLHRPQATKLSGIIPCSLPFRGFLGYVTGLRRYYLKMLSVAKITQSRW